MPRLFIQNIPQKTTSPPLSCKLLGIADAGCLEYGRTSEKSAGRLEMFFLWEEKSDGKSQGGPPHTNGSRLSKLVATQTFFYCSSRKFGEDEPNLTIIFFEMGWFNHQPVVNNPLIKAGYFLGALGRYP